MPDVPDLPIYLDAAASTPVRQDVLQVMLPYFAAEFANPTRGLPGGAIHDFLPHLAYLALHFFDYAEISRTAAFWSNRCGIDEIGFDSLHALARVGSGWKIYDLNVLGVWLVETYRNQFSQEISAKGLDGLIQSLTDKNKAFEQAAKKG